MPRPDRAALDGFAAALEARLDRANPPGRHPDTPALQRLNRTEYANAIRDLLAAGRGRQGDAAADDSIEGFDNIAEALTVSPSLIQGYVGAALKISRQAVGDRTAAPAQVTYSAPGQLAPRQARRGAAARHARRPARSRHFFPLDGEYEFTVGGGGGRRFSAPRPRVTLDGAAADGPQSARRSARRSPPGPHAIGVAIVDRAARGGRGRRRSRTSGSDCRVHDARRCARR